MKKITSIIIAIFLTGCITKSPHTINSYDLDISQTNNTLYKSNKTLQIDYPKALGVISGSRIYYKRGDITSYYLYSRWSNSLNSMLYKDILNAMKSRYKYVIGYNSEAKANLLLETQIIDFYHIVEDNNSYAKITILVRLIDLKNNNIIKSKTFEYKKEIATPNAQNFAKKAKEALKEFLKELEDSF